MIGRDRAEPLERLNKEGYLWVRNALPEDSLERLDAVCVPTGGAGQRGQPGSELHKALQSEPSLNALIDGLGYVSNPVRVVSFNKSADVNWALPWHQDRVIALSGRTENCDYSAWTSKGGVWHCEPPIHVLAKMIFVRVHLDDADAENGCLEIAPGTHLWGRVAADEVQRRVNGVEHYVCAAGRGDVLIVNALTLHRSRASRSGRRRRAIRIDYVMPEIVEDLDWAFTE